MQSWLAHLEKPDNVHLTPSSPAHFFILTTDMEGTLSQLEEHEVTEKVVTAASYAEFCNRADVFTFNDFVRIWWLPMSEWSLLDVCIYLLGIEW